VTIHQVHQEFLLQVVSYATMLLPPSCQYRSGGARKVQLKVLFLILKYNLQNLAKWSARLLETAPKLLHKELLSDQGFLVYVTRTYPAMVPYLKGFHLTIELWCGGRDADGWKLKGEMNSLSLRSPCLGVWT